MAHIETRPDESYATSTTGNSCSVVLTQSNGGSSSNWTNILHDTAWTDTLLDAGITSYVVVCNLDLDRCATSASY